MKRVLLVFATIYLLSSCDCFTICNTPIDISIVDKVTGEDLVFGNNPRYSVDSIFTKTTKDTNLRHIDIHNQGINLPFTDTIFLKLKSTDIDTLVVSYQKTRKTSKCCPEGVFRPVGISQNGVPTSFINSKFQLKK